MTDNTDIVNLALQAMGTRTTVSAVQLTNETTNEAIQANLQLTRTRDQLLRMAPWNFALKTANLVYITSAPGTPENSSAATTLWAPGQPAPPWAYEYQYPVDCQRACWIIAATQTGFSGIPITTAVTGGAPSFWQGPPVRFKVQNDTFWAAVGASIAVAGTGNAIGDIITLAQAAQGSAPIGAPAQLTVTTIDGSGGVTGASIVQSVRDTSPPVGGAYFAKQTTPQAIGSTTGAGVNTTFNLNWASAAGPQPVILTNQEFATMSYVQRVTDPNVMDELFIEAWRNILGAHLSLALTGDKKLANGLIQIANAAIMTARTYDGNEGLTINDVTPDFVRVRGIAMVDGYSGPYGQFDWGAAWPSF